MYQKTVLDNGLRVLTSHMPHVRSVSASLLVGAGSRYESLEKAGISHFVEHVLFKGTERRPDSRAIAEAIEGIGGVLNGGTDKELTVFWVKVMNSHLTEALDVLADLVRSPKFTQEEVEKERQVIIEEINMSLDSPQQRVNMLIDEVVWPDQPLGRDVAGAKETVCTFSARTLRDYWTSQYGPQNTVISVAGDVQHAQVAELANGLFGTWTVRQSGKWFPVNDSQEAARSAIEVRDTELTHLCIALRGVSSSHPDRFVFDVLNVILGEGMSCRLFRELREKRGLAYDVHSYVSHFFDSGSLTVYAGVAPGSVETAVEVILGLLTEMKTDRIPESELHKAKEMVKGRLVLRMEDSRSVAGWFASQELLLEEIRTVDEVIAIVEAMTPEDLQRVANDMFRTDRLNLAAVGPNLDESRLRAVLQL